MEHVSGDGHTWRINAIALTPLNVNTPGIVTPECEPARSYPNPFNASTTISYELKAISEVELCIYNLMGKKIATLVNQQQTAGKHSVIFDAGNLDSGIYIFRLRTGSLEQRGKLLLLE
jgi:hypothetical protein